MKRIGIIGCNCRENAIGKSLLKKSDIDIYYVGNHNNIGLDKLGCKYEKINISNSYNILNWAQKNNLICYYRT